MIAQGTHAPTRLIHEVRSALQARDDCQVMDLDDGWQPLAAQPQFYEPFCVKAQCPAFGSNLPGVLPLMPDVGYLLGQFSAQLSTRLITPRLTLPMFFEPPSQLDARGLPVEPKPFVFFHLYGYLIAIQVECPDVADITTVATLGAWINIQNDLV